MSADAKLHHTRLQVVTATRRTIDDPAHIVRQVASRVDYDAVPREQRWDIARGLLTALHAGPVGAGIAAPMTGLALRVVASTAGGKALVLFNPEVTETSGPEEAGEEGNLSLPGVRAPVARPRKATVRWQGLNTGQVHEGTFEAWEARVLMHEIEVLDGRLFVDHADAAPVGAFVSDLDRARRAVSLICGEDPPGLVSSDGLSLALQPPSLRGLDGVLTRPARGCGHLDGEHLRGLVQDMLRVQYEARGVGLAAPQVGLSLRLVVIDAGDRNPFVLIDPQVLDRDDHQELAMEGCLSIPGWRGAVARSLGIKVSTRTISGDATTLEFTGYMARVVQHELDHLDGVLFTERMDPDAQLVPTDAVDVANDLIKDLRRDEAQESRRSADRSNRSANKQKGGKRRRR